MNDAHTWFTQARYGLFIHWGLYAILAGEWDGKRTDNIAEWIMNDLNIPASEYEKLASGFNPVNFDAEWIVARAKDWGMRYITFTGKHHEGFAMYKSQCSGYNVVDASPYGRDVVKALSEACEKHGLPFCLYYSQAQDWHDPDGYMKNKDNGNKDFGRYLEEKCIPQLTELLTQYGPIGAIWFDTPMDMTREQSAELVRLVKRLQPDCLVSGRIGNGLGDYMTTGDNFIPAAYPGHPWEVPATLNGTWGFSRFDENWKKPEDIIRLMVKIAGRGGNYLLNIGPDGTGSVPAQSVRILDEVGEFLSRNGDSIYDTLPVPAYPYDIEGVYFTAKAHKLFIHMLKPFERLELLNIANTVRRAYLLKTGEEVSYRHRLTCENDHVWQFDLPHGREHAHDTVICVEMDEESPIFDPLGL